jgi:AraC-like DNA-binding protein
MSLKRQWLARGIRHRLESDFSSPLHWHAWDQLTYAAGGAMQLRGDRDTWLVPAGRALWIPARVRHAEHVRAPAVMTTLYFAAGSARGRPRQPAMVDVTPLLHELIAHIAARGELTRTAASHARLLGVLLDQLTPVPNTLQLPLPRDARARAVADRLRAQPRDDAPVHALGRDAGASGRTLERIFRSETGMTIGAWRRQLRLQHAVGTLVGGASVGTAAREAGYASPSAFIAVFKKTFGTTPKRY